jgi:glycerol-3-phosphate O-acyltransferase / dihydroxyacetone phosphate acyltransferase
VTAWFLALSGPALLAVAVVGALDLGRRRDLTALIKAGWVGAAVVAPPLAAVAYVLTRPAGASERASAGGAGADRARGPRERMLRRVGRAAARGLFRSVEVVRPATLPAGPQLLVASHFGALSDPIVLLAALDRPPRFLAAAGLFRVPGLGHVLRAAGAIPLLRSQDGAGAANTSAFEVAWASLRAGDPVAIFPEGIANDTAALAPLRTGAARLALGAAAPGTHVVPVGVHYEDKARLRRRVLVDVGEPLDLDAWLATRGLPRPAVVGEPPPGPTRELTAELTDRLGVVAPTFADADEQGTLLTAATIALRGPDGPASFGARADLADDLAARPATDRAAIVDAVAVYRDELDATGLDDAALAGGGGAPVRQLLLTLVVGALLLPPALLGAVVHAPLVLLVLLSGRLRVAPVTAATVRPAVAIVGAVLTWVTVSWWATRQGLVQGPAAIVAFGAVVLPLWGLAALVVAERLGLAASALGRGAHRLVTAAPPLHRDPAVLAPLLAARARVVELVGAAPPVSRSAGEAPDRR